MDRNPTFFPVIAMLTVPKAGSQPGQNDDAAAANPELGRFAVADGVSDSYDPGGWAQLLTSDFVDYRRDLRDIAAVEQWVTGLGARFSDRPAATGQTWYQTSKSAAGAAATFIGLELAPPGPDGFGGWTWIGVGDACLFQLGDGALLGVWPISDPAEFGVTPPALRDTPWQSGADAVRRGQGHYQRGDWFLLATDALAQFLLRRAATGDLAWQTWLDPSGQRFRERVEDLRDAGSLRNDDTTLLLIQAGTAIGGGRPPRPGIVIRSTERASAAEGRPAAGELVADFIPAMPVAPSRPRTWPQPEAEIPREESARSVPLVPDQAPREPRRVDPEVDDLVWVRRPSALPPPRFRGGDHQMAGVFPASLYRRKRSLAPTVLLVVAILMLGGVGVGWVIFRDDGSGGGNALATPGAVGSPAATAVGPATVQAIATEQPTETPVTDASNPLGPATPAPSDPQSVFPTPAETTAAPAVPSPTPTENGGP